MTSESRPNQILSMAERGVLYEPLTPTAFFDIVERVRNLERYQFHGLGDLGYFEITGELIDGRPIYDLFIKDAQLPKEKALTLAHEVVHIFWEEEPLGYKDMSPGNPGYGKTQNDADLVKVWGIKFGHEEKVEAEAKRFFRADHRMVLDTYRRMCANRGINV